MSVGASEVTATQKYSWKRGSGADDGRRAATPAAICVGVRAMPVTSVTRKTAQWAEAADSGTITDGRGHTCSEGADAFDVRDVGRCVGVCGKRAESRVTAVTRTAALRAGGRSCEPAFPTE
jgi:hypothetical protein